VDEAPYEVSFTNHDHGAGVDAGAASVDVTPHMRGGIFRARTTIASERAASASAAPAAAPAAGGGGGGGVKQKIGATAGATGAATTAGAATAAAATAGTASRPSPPS
jgi:hypothetical protein